MSQTALIEQHMARRRRLIAKQAATAGGQVLVLVPEVWLLEKVRAAFPAPAPVVIFYAGLTAQQQAEIWHQVQHNEIKIIIGTQKALWLPFQALSTIIVEEEYYPTHKLWDQYPRLSNLDGVAALASLWSADVVWAGSFPSLQLHHAWQQGQVTAIHWQPLRPRVHLIKTTYEDHRRGWILPREFIENLRPSARRREKVVILRNRYGPTGPAKIQALLKQIFGVQPKLVVDTAALFTEQQNARASRVVWLFPEDSLSFPDFRSAERAWYTLTRLQQLAGPRGLVTVVTRGQQAEHVAAVFKQRPAEFYTQQLAERKRFGYPPFTDMVRLSVIGKTAAAAAAKAEKLRGEIEKNILSSDLVVVRGPFASFEKTRQPQLHLLLTGSLAKLTKLYENRGADRVEVTPQRIL